MTVAADEAWVPVVVCVCVCGGGGEGGGGLEDVSSIEVSI